MHKQKIFITCIIVIILACNSDVAESKFQHNRKYHVGEVKNLKNFMKLIDNEKTLSDSFALDTFSRTRDYLKNRYRYYYDTIEYSDRVEVPKVKEYFSGRCFCEFSFGSISIKVPYLYKAPYMYYYSINIFKKGKFQSYQEVLDYERNQIQNEIPNKYQQLTLTEEPKFNGSETLTGLLRFKTSNKTHEPQVFSGGIYFTCEISDDKPQPYR